jgi:hypothetical protein
MGVSRTKKNQAYLLSPWRSQTQITGGFLLVVVVAALVAFIYLNTTAEAATIGRQIQDMQVNMDNPPELTDAEVDSADEKLSIEELSIRIADLETRLAVLTTQTLIEEKAKAQQMKPYDPEQAMYLSVPGYKGRSNVHLAPPPRLERASTPVLPAVYKQSLIDWVKIQIVQTSRMLFDEVGP